MVLLDAHINIVMFLLNTSKLAVRLLKLMLHVAVD